MPVEVPETVEKVILARIDRLDAEAREVLAAAAVLGRQFPLDLLEAVASDPTAIRGALRTLQRAELVREGARWPEPMFRFRHSLIQEAAYRSLLRRRRQELHARAAEGIEGLGGERAEALVGMLALHWEAAGDDERALAAHRRAAEAAGRLFALEEAIEHWTGVLEAARAAAACRHRGRGARRSPLARCAPLRPRRARRRADATWRRAWPGARAAGDREREVEILLELAGVMRNEDWTRALALYDDAVRAAEALGDSALRVNVLARGCIAYCNQLRLSRAVATGERALALAESGVGGRAGADLRARRAQAHRAAARRPRAARAARRSAAGARRRVLRGPDRAPVGPARGRLRRRSVPGGGTRPRLGFSAPATSAASAGRPCTTPRSPRASAGCTGAVGSTTRRWRSRGEVAEATYDVGAGEWAAWLDADLGWALLESGDRAGAVEVLARGARDGGGHRARPIRAHAARACWRGRTRRRATSTPARDALARAEAALGVVEVPEGRAWLFGGHAYVAAARARLALGDAAGAEALVAPLRAPAEDAGWREVAAAAALVVGLARAAAGDDAGAHEALDARAGHRRGDRAAGDRPRGRRGPQLSSSAMLAAARRAPSVSTGR